MKNNWKKFLQFHQMRLFWPAPKKVLVSKKILEAIIKRIPPPSPSEDDVVKGLVFDSVYDSFRGVVNYVRLMSGKLQRGTEIRLVSTGLVSQIKEVGVFSPVMTPTESLATGSVGYFIANYKISP